MATRLVNIDRDTPMLLPVDLRDWLPEDHMVHFVLDAVASLDLRRFKVNHRGSGSEQYPPGMLLGLMIYGYATGRMSSREIEAATHSDVAVRYICANTHPDHSTICTFREENDDLFKECFVKVLALAVELGHLKKVGGIAVDGSKIRANASKHAAVSYKRAGEMIEQLELEVEALMAKAERADNTPLEDGLTLPEEIVRRQDRRAKLAAARELIEARFEERRKGKEAAYQAKMAAREEKRNRGDSVRGRKPKPPSETPEDKEQVNFTDPDSRIMKAGNGTGYLQAYNAQLAVDTEGSYLILGQRVTAEPNDKEQLVPDVEAVPTAIRDVSDVLADTGFFSEDAVNTVEADDGPTAYVAVEKTHHGRTVEDLEKQPDPPSPPSDATTIDQMRHRLKTRDGKDKYRLRKQTVEPVFGIIKEVLGFRRFHLRGHPKVATEWTLVSLAYNVKRLFKLNGGSPMPASGLLNTQKG